MKKLWIFGVLGALVLLVIMGFSYYQSNFNREVAFGEAVTTQWSNVGVAYQKRTDLVPNLVNTVKGVANFEKSTLMGVVEARAKATSVQVDANNLSPEAMQNFSKTQDGLSSALSKLLVVVEKYPDLKANQSFLELQAQLEGIENRIAVERRKYNEVTKEYNTFIKQFPRTMIFHWNPKPYFEHSAGAEVAPQVQF